MKSICIKSNNKYIIDYLLKECSKIPLEAIYLSNHSFKIYHNVIVHYIGSDPHRFEHHICDILTKCILFFYERKIIKKLIDYHYFYFDDLEKQKILDNCIHSFSEAPLCQEKYDAIFSALHPYILEHHAIVLNGFVNFRLSEYRTLLEQHTDESVSQFLIEREYYEFIDILHLYVNSKPSQVPLIHLVYSNQEAILLDERKDIIPIDTQLSSATYLSDISFSSNDYCMNTLLNLLPNQLHIHIIDECQDEFITTLKLIFDSRAFVCTDCDICHVYRLTRHVASKE